MQGDTQAAAVQTIRTCFSGVRGIKKNKGPRKKEPLLADQAVISTARNH